MNVCVKEYTLKPGVNLLMLSSHVKNISFLMVEENPTLLCLEPISIDIREERKFYLAAGAEVFYGDEIIKFIGAVSEEPIYWHLFEMKQFNG